MLDHGREDVHRVVMRCYVRRGERAAALRHYQVCAHILRAEFDAAPEPIPLLAMHTSSSLTSDSRSAWAI